MRTNQRTIGIGQTVKHMGFNTRIYIVAIDEDEQIYTGRYQLKDGQFAEYNFFEHELTHYSNEEATIKI